jgi:hypothetical protein
LEERKKVEFDSRSFDETSSIAIEAILPIPLSQNTGKAPPAKLSR